MPFVGLGVRSPTRSGLQQSRNRSADSLSSSSKRGGGRSSQGSPLRTTSQPVPFVFPAAVPVLTTVRNAPTNTEPDAAAGPPASGAGNGLEREREGEVPMEIMVSPNGPVGMGQPGSQPVPLALQPEQEAVHVEEEEMGPESEAGTAGTGAAAVGLKLEPLQQQLQRTPSLCRLDLARECTQSLHEEQSPETVM
eukprot:RCo053045